MPDNRNKTMQYEKDVIYSLKVTGTMITNDCHYYLIVNYRVFLPIF